MWPATSNTMIEAMIGEAVDPATRENAWKRFVKEYDQPVRTLCKARLPTGDLDDAVQCVLVQLFANLKKYAKQTDGQFRRWLSIVIRNAVVTEYRRGRHFTSLGPLPDDDTLQEQPRSGPIRLADELANAVGQKLDDELKWLLQEVRSRVSDRDWDIFVRFDAGEGPAEIGATHQLDAANTGKIALRVKRLAAELWSTRPGHSNS